MAEASAATTIQHDGPDVYSSGGACLRHARPNHICRPLYVSSSAVSLPKRLHTFWVMGRLYTSRTTGATCIVVAALASAMLRHADLMPMGCNSLRPYE